MMQATENSILILSHPKGKKEEVLWISLTNDKIHHNRNYRESSRLSFGDLKVRGFSHIAEELDCVVIENEDSGDLLIAKMNLAESSINTNFHYTQIYSVLVCEKCTKPGGGVIVKQAEDMLFLATDGLNLSGQSQITFAVYGQSSNITEFEIRTGEEDETVRAIESDMHSDRAILVSQAGANTGVRAFSLKRKTLEYNITVLNGNYIGSTTLKNLLLLILMTLDNTDGSSVVEIKLFIAESGEAWNENEEYKLVGPVIGLSMDWLGSTLYLLVKVTQAGNVSYSLGNNLEYSSPGYSLLLFDVLDNGTVQLIDNKFITSDYEIQKVFIVKNFSEPLIVASLEDFSSLIFLTADEETKFFTKENCTDSQCASCLRANLSFCVECLIPSRVLSHHQCMTYCDNGYYFSNNECVKCHYSCLTCNGPLAQNCLSCDSNRIFSSLSQECFCKPSQPYTLKTQCVANCAAGQAGFLKSKLCVERCPSYLFSSLDFSSTSIPLVTPSYSPSMESGTDLLEFSYDSSSCLKLPGPPGSVHIPSEFTISFWIFRKPGWLDESRTLVSGFNSFYIKCTTSSGIDFVQFGLRNSNGSDYLIPSVAVTEAQFVPNAWNYIAASFRIQSTPHIKAVLYVVPESTTQRNPAGTLSLTSTHNFPEYVNSLFVGCSASISGNTLVVDEGIKFDGYIRELLLLQHFFNFPALHQNRHRVISSSQELYSVVLGYWRFDLLSSNSSFVTLLDSSRFNQTTNLSISSNPTKSSVTSPAICSVSFENLVPCADLFGSENLPFYSYTLNTLAESLLQPFIWLNKEVLAGSQTREDFLEFRINETTVQTVGLGENGEVQVNRALPLESYGKHLDIYYYLSKFRQYKRVLQIYIPLPPESAQLSNTIFQYQSSETLYLKLFGGNQALNNEISFYNIEQDPESAISETIFVYPSLAFPQKISTPNGISVSQLESGTYTLMLRNGFNSHVRLDGTEEYKNLHLLLYIQNIPKVKFEYDSVSNLLKNEIMFKGELYYPNIQGSGQSDGDEIMFATVGCLYSYKRGPIFNRLNGTYPGVWFGEEVGVHNLLLDMTRDRLFLCWRPAARAFRIIPEYDTWSYLPDSTGFLSRSVIKYYNLTANQQLPEILVVYPPVEYPILAKGRSIYFSISKIFTKMMKPSAYAGIPGRIQVRSALNSENIVWEQLFHSEPDNQDSSFSVGKLHGNSQCNYTLLGLSGLIPGQSYELVIFSRSFKSNLTGEFLFGELSPNIPVFVYRFSYQEISPPSVVAQLASSETATFSCNLLGDVSVGNSIHYLFSVFTGSRFTLIHNVLRENPSQITVPSTAGSMLLLRFSKITSENQFIHYYHNISTSIQNCYLTCKTCSGTEYDQCLSCYEGGTNPYFYLGQCLEQCPDSAPYVAVSSSGRYCLDKCPSGQYYSRELHLCTNCSSSCAECSGEGGGLCLRCSSYTNVSLEGEAQYAERFFFDGSCPISCPSVLGFYNLITEDNVTHQCIKQVQNPQGIGITLQKLQYDKLDLSQSTKIRALINDSNGLIKGIRWFTYPFEDLDKYCTDKAFFSEYYKESDLPFFQQINPNYFNYKSSEEVFVGVVAYTANYESIAFDLMKLQGSYPPSLSKAQISFTPPINTLSVFSLSISGLPSSGAYCAVMLEPQSLSLYGVDESSSLLSLTKSQLLLQPYTFVTSNYMTLTQIPILIEGPRTILDYGTSKNIIAKLTVRCKNKFMAASEVAYSLNLTEHFQPSSMRESKIMELYEKSIGITLIETALQIGNTLRVILPNNSLPENAQCIADADCENKGFCINGKCSCQPGFKGATCKFSYSEYVKIQNLLINLINFLHTYCQSYVGPSLVLVRHLHSVLEGSLRCPEFLSKNQSVLILTLVERMMDVSQKQARLLSEYDILAILRVVNFLFDYLRNLYWPNIFQLLKFKSLNTLESWAKFNNIRNELSTNILMIVQSLYNFLNLVSAQLYPGSAAICEAFSNFEVYIWASTEALMFKNYQENHGVELGNLYIKIPANFFSGLRANLPYYSEFKIRVVKWVINPFIFSEHSSYFSSNILNIAILDANSSQIPITNFPEQPILILWDQETIESPSQCAYLNISHQKSTTLSRELMLDWSMAVSKESLLSFPIELFYQNSNLMFQVTEYFHKEMNYPEFEFVNGVSEISKQAHSTSPICATFLFGDIVLISSSAKHLEKYSSGFYNYTNFWDLWPRCFGFWALIATFSTFSVILISVIILDKKLIPIAKAKIEARLSENKILRMESVIDNKSSVEILNYSTVMEILKDQPEKRRHAKIIKLSTISNSDQDSPKKVFNSSRNSIDDLLPSQLVERKDQATVEKQITERKQEENCTIVIDNNTAVDFPKSVVTQDNYIPRRTIEVQPEPNSKQEEGESPPAFDSPRHKPNLPHYTLYNYLIEFHQVLNLFFITSVVFYRHERCILLFNHTILLLFWTSVLLRFQYSSLDPALDLFTSTDLLISNLWIPFFTPLLSSMVVCFQAWMMKSNELKAYSAETAHLFNQILEDTRERMRIRKCLVYLSSAIFAAISTGFTLEFSAFAGKKVNWVWLWTLLLSFPVGFGLYHVILGVLLYFGNLYLPSITKRISTLRDLKRATVLRQQIPQYSGEKTKLFTCSWSHNNWHKMIVILIAIFSPHNISKILSNYKLASV